MFFNSSGLSNLEAGVDLAWAKQQLHSQNISNVETPGYKSKQMEFSKVLENAENGGRDGNLRVTAKITSDENSSVLPNGNNVDFDKENVELYKSYVQYSMLIDKISGKFTNYSYVLNSNIK